jgi:protein TonB
MQLPSVASLDRSKIAAEAGGIVAVSGASAPPGNALVRMETEAPARPMPKPLLKPVSGGVLNGTAVSLPKPIYPDSARQMRASGVVTVEVIVDETGKIISARATSGHNMLRDAAVQAALKARFTPTKVSGQPVKVSGLITYNFSLGQ